MPTRGNFFAPVKSVYTYIAISGNFVLTAKNSNDLKDYGLRIQERLRLSGSGGNFS